MLYNYTIFRKKFKLRYDIVKKDWTVITNGGVAMESMTKNRQSADVINQMVERIFSPLKMTGYRELTEGFFNAAYEVELNDGSSVILKVAPPADVRVQIYEKNIMSAEVQAMEMLLRHGGIPVPHVYGYDDSRTVCGSPYFFMEKLRGKSLNEIRYALSQEQIDDIYLETGRLVRAVNDIVCPHFGFPGQPEYQGKEWYPVFYKMMTAAIEDARQVDIELEVPPDELMNMLRQDEAIFNEVTEPHLVHYDCWDGNIFVENGRITGIIDWERALWADTLMEVEFRRFFPNLVFAKGYGLETLSESQIRRALWYDIYMMVLIAAECEYRKYRMEDVYSWAPGVLKRQFEELKKQGSL